MPTRCPGPADRPRPRGTRSAAAGAAPELTDGGGADERADLYSLGATIYEMAAGRPPFAGGRAEILAARRAGPPPSLQRQDLPAALRNLISCLLSADRTQRPASAPEVLEQLQGIRTARADIEQLLASDESARLDFKASLREPVDRNPGDKRCWAPRCYRRPGTGMACRSSDGTSGTSSTTATRPGQSWSSCRDRRAAGAPGFVLPAARRSRPPRARPAPPGVLHRP